MFSHRAWRFIFIVRKACLDLKESEGPNPPKCHPSRGYQPSLSPEKIAYQGLISRKGWSLRGVGPLKFPSSTATELVRVSCLGFSLGWKDSYLKCTPEKLPAGNLNITQFKRKIIFHPPPCVWGFKMLNVPGCVPWQTKHLRVTQQAGQHLEVLDPPRPPYHLKQSQNSLELNRWRGSNGEFSGPFFSPQIEELFDLFI